MLACMPFQARYMVPTSAVDGVCISRARSQLHALARRSCTPIDMDACRRHVLHFQKVQRSCSPGPASDSRSRPCQGINAGPGTLACASAWAWSRAAASRSSAVAAAAASSPAASARARRLAASSRAPRSALPAQPCHSPTGLLDSAGKEDCYRRCELPQCSTGRSSVLVLSSP